MHRHTKDVDINKILQVAESLENIVCRCFGPDGGQVLFIKSTGDLLITKDGRRILEYLLLDHPIARMIVNSASRHYSITGDGVKSFILLLCAVLRELQATAEKNEGLLLSGNSTVKTRSQRQGHVLRRISNMLLIFQSRVLEHIIAKHLRPHFLSVFSNGKEEIILCRTSIQQTLHAYFCGRIGYNSQVFISTLACDYLYKCLLCIDNILNVVSLVSKYFTELHTEVPGLPVDNSRILPGLVLHRPFSVYCPAEGELQALIVTEQIHQSLSAFDIGFVVSSDIQLQLSQRYLRERTEYVIKQLQNNQIKLIFSSVRQQEIVLFYAKLSGISIVDCLTSEEIDLLCTITGATPLSKPLSDVLLTDSFLATSCRPVLIGCNKYVHLILSGSLAFKPHTLVFCGPVKGQTEQLASSCHGAFKMLKHLFQPIDSNWEQPTNNPGNCFPNRSVFAQDQGVTCSKCQNDSACGECQLLKTTQAIYMDCTDEEEKDVSKCAVGERLANLSTSHRCMGTCKMCLNQVEDKLQYLKMEDDCLSSISTDFRHKSSANTATQIQPKSLENVGLVLPGGGAFEMLLQYHLQNFVKTCKEEELAMISTMFGNALLCIPRYIYQAKKGKICFPLVYSQFTNAFKNQGLIDVAQTGLESVSCKYQLVASVLHCISKLVSINLIVGIKRVPISTENEETDEDI
ncbi:BBSome complex assembly protein BBS10 [Mixophyes fleayi]|uniref:BBSome complex assembly protein BBS10 n=1 Tax=Mixophyes fleayi TaxID=3061075 RepID=UPI003F4DAC02